MLKKTPIFIVIVALVAGVGFAQKDPSGNQPPFPDSRGGFMLPGETCSGNGGTDCTIALPDNDPAGVTSSFDFSGCSDIADVNVGLDISSTWVGDLIVSVEGPSTSTVVLMDRPGVPASTFGCSGDNVAAVMDDEGTAPVEDECPATDPVLQGNLIPQEALAAFIGESADGTWTLSASDNAGGDDNTLNDWSLEVTCAVAPPTLTEVPTMTTWGILAMLALLGFVAIRVLRS